MDAMALTKLGQNGPVPAQPANRNRKYSLYASRIQPLRIDSNVREEKTLPDLPSLSISPRWDSLSHGLHLSHQTSPTPGLITPAATRLDASPIQAFPTLVGSGLSTPISSPRSIMPDDPDARCDSPSRSVRTKSSLVDMRSPEGSPAVENFSRPRKPSIRQTVWFERPVSPESAAAKPPLSAAIVNLSDRLYDSSGPSSPQTPPWQRPRRPSASSVKSSCVPGSPLHLVNGDHYAEAKPPPYRGRNVTGPPTLASARTQLASSRAENVVWTPLTSPGYGGATPWVSGDELRSSFRSQLTASTTPGTVVTERSSILTKASSIASLLDNSDEPSLEDVMGMYEKGFADDEDEHNAALDIDKARLGVSGSRPRIAALESETRSALVARSFPVVAPMALESLTPPMSTSRSTLDAEIRQSRMIFTSPAFTSSVAAITGKADTDFSEKRDSAKSLDSEPSIASDKQEKKKKKTQLVSPPASRSPSPSPAIASEPSLLPPSAPLEAEDPGSRDRYGFKKANQSITREQYDAWNKDYSAYLARRRRKWVAYLKDCALMTDRPIRFPSPSAKTKRFVRKGIPPDWRGAAWFYYAGGPAILAKHSGLYEKLLHKRAKQVDVEAIERDLHRTFPDNIQFKPSAQTNTKPGSERDSQSTMTRSSMSESSPGPPPASSNEPPIITSLRRVLHAFSIYNPRIGYCQSLNFLAGLLLLFVETEEQCFWLLNVITIIYLPGTHDMSLEGSKVDLGVLMTELHESMPSVWDKIGGELESLPTGRPSTSKSVRRARPILRRRDQPPGLSTDRLPPITLCMTAWFMSCYIGTLPIETTLRVWDVFFYEGSKTLFRIALAIFKSGESEIKAVKDPMEMFGVVQTIPRRMLDANALLEACFRRRNGFGHLSQGAIDERRQERRDLAKQELEQKMQGGRAGLDGSLTEAESGTVSRRGTLFGKKKKEAVNKGRPAEM